jgi:hypothetical protein
MGIGEGVTEGGVAKYRKDVRAGLPVGTAGHAFDPAWKPLLCWHRPEFGSAQTGRYSLGAEGPINQQREKDENKRLIEVNNSFKQQNHCKHIT